MFRKSSSVSYFPRTEIFRRLGRLGVIVALATSLASCMTTGLGRTPVPANLTTMVSIGDGEDVLRYWGDDDTSSASNPGVVPANFKRLAASRQVNFLTLSGGGYNGAFGTGYLLGWSERGDRPSFDIVTGISVGALIAPLAFLGPEYDQRLLEAFELIATNREHGSGLLGVFFGAAGFESSKHIERAIESVITPETLAKIGEQHRAGRRLLVGTTNLDVERPVIWDIGAIALSAVPDKVELVRKIILASSAVPGIYPPVLINVHADGMVYDELHVDGGITQQVVLLPDNLNLRRTDPKTGERLRRNMYVIFNGKVEPDYEPVRATAMDIMFRAVPAFIKSLGRGDVKRLEATALKYGASYRIVAMPADAQAENNFSPDPDALHALIQLGHEMGAAGEWRD